MEKFSEKFLDLVKEAETKMLEAMTNAGLTSVQVSLNLFDLNSNASSFQIEKVELKDDRYGGTYIARYDKYGKEIKDIGARNLFHLADSVICRCRPASSFEQVEEALRNICVSGSIIEFEKDGRQAFEITIDGDWKHDHGACRWVMEELGYLYLGEDIIDDGGGDDWYEATHTYIK